MNIDRFLLLLQDRSKTKADLVSMRENALAAKGTEYVDLVERVLDERFPDWRPVPARRGRSQPTSVMFLGSTKHFPSEKEAYVWLMECFVQRFPKLFEDIDSTSAVAPGTRTVYFARSLKKLFKTAPAHASDQTKYHKLKNGWYAKLGLSKVKKVELLMRFATAGKLRMGVDWDWSDRA